jgi:predicted RNA-binding protein Jag
MSNTIESKGRSVEEAISEALLRTGWRRDEVDVTVLEQPKGGLFGLFGGKPAKVRVERKSGGGERRGRGGRDDGRLDAPRGDQRGGGRDRNRDQRGGRATENRGQEKRGPENRGAEVRTDKRGGEGRPEASRGEARGDGRSDGRGGEARGGRDRDQRGGRGRDRDRDRPRQEPIATSPAASAEQTVDRTPTGEDGGRSSSRRRRRRPTHQRDNMPVETRGAEETPAVFTEAVNDAPRTVEPVEAAPAPVAPEAPATLFDNEPTRGPAAAVVPEERRDEVPGDTPGGLEVSVSASERIKPYGRPATVPATELLQTVATDLMLHAGFPCRCEVREGEYDLVKLIVEDRSAHVLVGRYGAAVDALEHLVEKISSQVVGDRVRMNLDVNNFRRRREEHLVQVARNVVREVRETGEPIHLDPLCARERRIVHLQVMDIPGVATYTVQDENGKHVVVATEEYVRAAAEAAGTAHLSHEDDTHADDVHLEGAAGGDAGDRA